jgi:hypothetical protein
MTDIFDDEYWSSQFDITQDDLKRIVKRLERVETPQDLKVIALQIIRGRIEHGEDLSPAVIERITGQPSVRLWDPEKDWSIGDIVIIAYDHNSDSIHDPFVSEVVHTDEKSVKVKVDALAKEITFSKWRPEWPNMKKYDPETWRESVRSSVREKIQSGDVNHQSEGILLKHGEHILSRLSDVLRSDAQFTGLEGKWYLTSKLPALESKTLKALHMQLRGSPSGSLDEMVSSIKESSQFDGALLRLSVCAAMQNMPERFENVGTPISPKWKARLPEPGNAEVIYYAYDPKTYEILCCPGQRLTHKQAQRLQELGYYEHLVTFAE